MSCQSINYRRCLSLATSNPRLLALGMRPKSNLVAGRRYRGHARARHPRYSVCTTSSFDSRGLGLAGAPSLPYPPPPITNGTQERHPNQPRFKTEGSKTCCRPMRGLQILDQAAFVATPLPLPHPFHQPAAARNNAWAFLKSLVQVLHKASTGCRGWYRNVRTLCCQIL